MRAVPFCALTLLSGCAATDRILGRGANSGCDGPTSYQAGSTASGTMGVHNCSGAHGGSGQVYTMALSQQSNMQLTVTTTAFTPFLGVYTAAGKVVAEDLTGTPLKVFLPAGTYQVFVGKAAGSDGAFTLTSPAAALGGCASPAGTRSDADLGFTTRGAAFSGTVTDRDCGALNAKTQVYVVRLATGDTLNASVTVDRMAGLYLVNSTGVTVAHKELPGPDTWAAAYVATADGDYTVHLESRSDSASSNLPLGYTLVLR